MKEPLHPLQEVRATELAVRKATAADATTISALLKGAFAEFEALYTPEAFAVTVLGDSGVLARLEEGPLWVAEIGPAIIGTVGAKRVADSVMVRGMAAHPSARGLGVGKCLLDHVECFAIQDGGSISGAVHNRFPRSSNPLVPSGGVRIHWREGESARHRAAAHDKSSDSVRFDDDGVASSSRPHQAIREPAVQLRPRSAEPESGSEVCNSC